LAKNFRAASIQVIDDFLTSSKIQIVHLDPDLFHKSFSLYRSRLDQTWGLVDCVIHCDAGSGYRSVVNDRQTL